MPPRPQRSAFSLLAEGPIPLAPEAETLAQRIAANAEVLRAGALAEAGNPYQRSFWRFLDLVRTVDEAAGGEIAAFPKDPYLFEVCEYLVTEPLLFFEKSRRVRLTWTVSAFDLWVAVGGQDPRWPALMRSTGHRNVLIISKKEDDADWVISKRIQLIYEQLREHDIERYWPGFPTCKFSHTEANWSNGSQIKALPQGEKQVRQFAATLDHYEEFAHSDDAKATLAAALPTLMGRAGMGGHAVLICTPQVGSYAFDLREDVDE